MFGHVADLLQAKKQLDQLDLGHDVRQKSQGTDNHYKNGR